MRHRESLLWNPLSHISNPLSPGTAQSFLRDITWLSQAHQKRISFPWGQLIGDLNYIWKTPLTAAPRFMPDWIIEMYTHQGWEPLVLSRSLPFTVGLLKSPSIFFPSLVLLICLGIWLSASYVILKRASDSNFLIFFPFFLTLVWLLRKYYLL